MDGQDSFERMHAEQARLAGLSMLAFLLVAAFLVAALATTVTRSLGGLHDTAGHGAAPAVGVPVGPG